MLSLYERLAASAAQAGRDLFFVQNGDLNDGTGLSRVPPATLLPLIQKMPFDALTTVADATPSVAGAEALATHFSERELSTTSVPAGISAADVRESLRAHFELELSVPRVGSLGGEPGKSLKIRITGPKAGTWADYAASKSDPRGTGDLLKLMQYTIGGGDLGTAVREAKRMLSIDSMTVGHCRSCRTVE